MTIYVDSPFNATPRTEQAKRHGNTWCHLMVDGDLEELHKFAASIGLKRSWFHRSMVPHYDLAPGKREQALKSGAVEKPTRDLSELRQSWMKRWNGGNPDWEERS